MPIHRKDGPNAALVMQADFNDLLENRALGRFPKPHDVIGEAGEEQLAQRVVQDRNAGTDLVGNHYVVHQALLRDGSVCGFVGRHKVPRALQAIVLYEHAVVLVLLRWREVVRQRRHFSTDLT